MDISLSEWISLPFLGKQYLWIALIIYILTLLCMIAALWRVRISGGVSTNERRHHEKKSANYGNVFWTNLAPIAIIIGLGLFLFRITPPKNLIYISSIRMNKELSEEIKQKLHTFIRNNKRRACINPQPYINMVLNELRENMPQDSGVANRSVLQRAVVKAIKRVLFQDVEKWKYIHSKEIEASLDIVIGSAIDDIPHWLVISVEIAIIKILMQIENISNTFICIPQYNSGTKVDWNWIDRYFCEDDLRLHRRKIEIVPMVKRGSVFIEKVTAFTRKDDEIIVKCLLWKEAKSQAISSVNVEVSLDNKYTASNFVLLEEQENFSEQEFIFSCSDKNFVPQSLIDKKTKRHVPIARKLVKKNPATFVVNLAGSQANSARYTYDMLLNKSEFSTWRNELQKKGFTASIICTYEVDHSDITVEVANNSVWIYPTQISHVISHMTTAKHQTNKQLIMRVDSVPGIYSLNNLALPQNEIFTTTGNCIERIGRVFKLHPVLGELDAVPDLEGQPFISHLQHNDHLIVHIGLALHKQNMLLDHNGDWLLVCCIWTSILEAIHHTGNGLGTRDLPDYEYERPMILLNSTDISIIRARGIIYALYSLLFGVTIYALFVLRAIVSIPK